MSKLAPSSLKTSATKTVAPAPTPATPPAEPDTKRQRVPYVPRSVADFEMETARSAETVRTFKARLYPTNSAKASMDNPPTRREFDDLASHIRSLNRDYKAQARQSSARPRRQVDPNAEVKPRSGGFKNPCRVTEPLAQFLSDNFNTDNLTVVDETRISTRALLTSVFTQYTYDKNLRDPESPTKIIPDKAMSDLFKNDFGPAGVDPKGFPHTHMQKLLTRHVTPAQEFKDYLTSQGSELNLDNYKSHLETVQAHFKSAKATREASRPKVRKAPKKKEVAEVAPAQ